MSLEETAGEGGKAGRKKDVVAVERFEWHSKKERVACMDTGRYTGEAGVHKSAQCAQWTIMLMGQETQVSGLIYMYYGVGTQA